VKINPAPSNTTVNIPDRTPVLVDFVISKRLFMITLSSHTGPDVIVARPRFVGP
jgi:hypothetical protein